MEFKLIIKKLNNNLSKAEAVVFTNWYNATPRHSKYFEQVKTNFERDIKIIDLEKSWANLESQMDAPKSKPVWKYAVAAAVILALTTTLIFQLNETTTLPPPSLEEHQITSGTDKATLTLEDGSNIALVKGEIFNLEHAKSNGEALTYMPPIAAPKSEIAYNYLTVPRGGQFFVELSDGTQIWLNAESQLKYPVSFKNGETRHVELVYGEAYFDISPSTAHNGDIFTVKSNEQIIEVLGTEFNVKAYKDEAQVLTTLVEGLVAINHMNITKHLTPGEQSILNLKNNNIQVSQADTESVIGWKNGVFVFNDEPLETIMHTLSRWYDMDVEFQDLDKKHLEFSGILSRTKDINDLLDNFKKTNEVSFEFSNKSILIQ